MRYLFLFLLILSLLKGVHAQQSHFASPCATDSLYRQFDFWIGEWNVFNLQGKKAGVSKISLILDSCIILEEWTSIPTSGPFIYKGKSFNTYNATTHQWQQTWVDNMGHSTHYVYGEYKKGKIIFLTKPWQFSKDTMAINRLTFFNLGPDRIRQLGEISKDDGKTWTTQYDLEYRRKKQ